MIGNILSKLSTVGLTATAWGFRGLEAGSKGLTKGLGWAKGAIPGAVDWMGAHPGAMKAAAVAGAGGVGYMSAGGGYQGAERGAAFALGAGFLVKPGMRKMFEGIGRAGKVGMERTGSVPGTLRHLAEMTPGVGAIARNPFKSAVAGGAIYGALDSDTNILSGAAVGAMGGFVARRWPGKGKGFIGNAPFIGMTAGAGLGLIRGEGGMDVLKGAAVGGAIGLGAKAVIKHPIAAGIPAMGTAMVGVASAEAYSAVRSQRASYDLDADGALTLGLHSMRHG